MMIVLVLATVMGLCVGAPQAAFNVPVPSIPSGLYDLPNAGGSSSSSSSSSTSNVRVSTSQANPLPPLPPSVPLPPVPAPPPVPTPPPTTTTFAPPMPYQFSYNIMDGISSVYSERTEEQLDGGPLVGSYSYLRPDGIYMTVIYTADENGYRAEVIESSEAPPTLQTVEPNRAKYEVSLPGADSYLVDVTDEELREYIAQAAAFESSQIEESSQQTQSQAQTNFESQFSNQSQTQPQVPTSDASIISNSQISSSSSIQSPPVRGVKPPSGYSYPQPSIPFSF